MHVLQTCCSEVVLPLMTTALDTKSRQGLEAISCCKAKSTQAALDEDDARPGHARVTPGLHI